MRAPVVFDPAVHLCYQPPEKVITMQELALDGGISPIGVTAPFPLLTREGVTELRRESEIRPLAVRSSAS